MIQSSIRTQATAASVRHLLLMGMLVVAMLMRGLVPAGYMPSSSKDGQGFFSLEICSADNTVKTILMSLSGDDITSPDTDDRPSGQACVFAGLGALFLFGVIHGLWAVVLHDTAPLAGTAYTSPSFLFIAGFPLGSRAPPVL